MLGIYWSTRLASILAWSAPDWSYCRKIFFFLKKRCIFQPGIIVGRFGVAAGRWRQCSTLGVCPCSWPITPVSWHPVSGSSSTVLDNLKHDTNILTLHGQPHSPHLYHEATAWHNRRTRSSECDHSLRGAPATTKHTSPIATLASQQPDTSTIKAFQISRKSKAINL